MTKEQRILTAVRELVDATRNTASSAAQLKGLLLNDEISLVPDVTIVHQAATLLQHTTEQFARNRILAEIQARPDQSADKPKRRHK